MKRFIALSLILSFAFATAAFAGEGKCTASTQECLDKYATHMAMAGWAGFEGEFSDETGIFTITSVHAESPAEVAGFKSGDEVFAWNGMKFADMGEEDWGKTEAKRAAGKVAKYTLTRDGYEKTLELTYAKMPEDMIAKKIGKHLLGHVTVASVQ